MTKESLKEKSFCQIEEIGWAENFSAPLCVIIKTIITTTIIKSAKIKIFIVKVRTTESRVWSGNRKSWIFH